MKKTIASFEKELTGVAGLAQSSVETYVSSVTAFCEFAGKTCNVDPFEATGHHLLDWFSSIRNTIGASRLRQHQFAIKKFFSFLEKRGVIHKNPAKSLPRIGMKNSGKHTAVSAGSVFKLLGAVDRTTWLGARNHLIIAMLWCLGLRISELTKLTVGSFEPHYEPKSRIGLLRVRGKNQKQRALFVVDALHDELCGYLTLRESPKGREQPLFPVNLQQNTPLSTNRIQKFFKEYTKLAGLTEHITPHRLRHSFATEMYRQKVPITAIQGMLGHTRKAETSVYVHVPDKMKNRALAQLAIFGGEPCR